MKKRFLLLGILAFSFLIISCSGDESSTPDTTGIVKFKFDGVEKTFTHLQIDTSRVEGDVVVRVRKTNNQGSLDFNFTVSPTSTNSLNRFTYIQNATIYSDTTSEFHFNNMPQSIDGHAYGTFNGLMGGFESGQPVGQDVELTEGTFEINYPINN